METITCEVKGSTHKIIATADTMEDAEEIAVESGARYERESGDWACAECVAEWEAEGMALAAKYDREQRFRQMREDDQDTRDAMLSNADFVYDRARDNGEI